jgi:hypothetical protein
MPTLRDRVWKALTKIDGADEGSSVFAEDGRHAVAMRSTASRVNHGALWMARQGAPRMEYVTSRDDVFAP